MEVEIIKAIGQYIVVPICICGSFSFFIWLMWK